MEFHSRFLFIFLVYLTPHLLSELSFFYKKCRVDKKDRAATLYLSMNSFNPISQPVTPCPTIQSGEFGYILS